MTPAELELIRREVRLEIRTAALLDRPREHRAPPPSDAATECTVLATMFEGHAAPAWLAANHFLVPLHAHLFDLLSVVLESGILPDLSLIERLFRRSLDCADETIATVRDIVNNTAAQLPIAPAARRLVSLHARREALYHIAKADALLRLPTTDDSADIANELLIATDLLHDTRPPA